MNIHQMYHYRGHCARQAGLLKWSIDTIEGDLKVFKVTPERLIYWQEKIAQKKADLRLFLDEIEIINQHIPMEWERLERESA